MMKRLFPLFAFSLLAATAITIFNACARKATASETAESFLLAMSEGDLNTAKIMVEEEGEKVILAVKDSHFELKAGDTQITIVDETSKGDQAIVRYKYKGNEEVKTIKLRSSDDDDWQIIVDGDTEEVIIGSESIKEILAEVNLTVSEALSLSEDALEMTLKSAGEALEITGKTLQEVSGKLGKDLKNAAEDLDAAKDDIKEAMKEIQEAFEENSKNN